MSVATPKCIVCTCEDVTDEEILDAVAAGYRDLESIKRYTGLATGPCQGKACVTLAQRVLVRETGQSLEDVGTITFRPPLQPVPLRFLAGAAEGEAPRDDRPRKPGGELTEEES